MPVKQKKDLYIAQSVHDLNLKTKVETDKNTKLKIYCKSADKMFKEAAKADSNQDEERAYVLYMKFTSLVQYICKSKDYKAEKEFYDSLAGVKNVLTAITKAEILQESLLKRYEDLKEEAEVKAKLESEEKRSRENSINGDVPSNEVTQAKDTTPTPEYGQDGRITSAQLYSFFQDNSKNILVMDARPKEHYQSSHMKYPQVISVPQEAISPGATVTVIAKGLSADVRTSWDKRGMVDYIILLDWNSSAKDLTKGSTLAYLKDAIYKWDSTVTLKSQPLVLDGGYEDWLFRYPMFTTNAHVTGPTKRNDTSSTSLTLLDFDYPSLEDDRPKVDPTPKMTAQKASLPDNNKEPSVNSGSSATVAPAAAAAAAAPAAASAVSSAKSIPAVNRSSKPKQIQDSLSSGSKPQTSMPSSGTAASAQSKPAVDNSSKASSTPATLPVNNSSASSLNANVPSLPSPESARVSYSKPEIPNRSLKPSEQNDKSQQDAGQGMGKAETPSLATRDVTDGQTPMKQTGSVDGISEEAKGTELGKINQMQKENQLQEEQARQELVKMRQDKMRTENKQLRLEKAKVEKELEEKVEALKRMQQELNAQKHQLEQNEAAKAEEAQQELEKKQEPASETDAQVAPAAPHQEAKPPSPTKTEQVPQLESKPSPAKTISPSPESVMKKDPQQRGESTVHRPPQAEPKKPAGQQPSGQPLQQSSSAPGIARTPAPAHPTPTVTLPPGWERRWQQSSNKYYYLDHTTGTTHWNPPVIGPGGAATMAPVSTAKPVVTTSSPQQPEAKPTASGSPARQTTLSPSISKTRLKSDSSVPAQSGLKRSFSSPNIAQMVMNEQDTPIVPTVNRAVKPIQRMPSKQLPVTRARNLNPVYGNQGRSLTGLRNLGNTCFMNSVVQCLSSSAPLTHYFITDKYVLDINRQNPLGRGGNVALEFAIVIKALWSGQYRSISPLDLRDTVTKYVPEFRQNIGHHHDSQEFLLFLLDGLHEDLNQVKKREYIKEDDLEKYPDHQAAEISWACHERLNQSIIVTLFQGQFKSTVCCLTCGHKSVKFEAFMYLSLPIPSSNRCTLQQCLQKFSTEEKLTGDNAIFCSRCKTNRDSAKIILIWKLPRILLIHLKRFYHEGMWRQKLQTMVDFPVVNMDMSPYTRGPKPSRPYRLHAVSNHIGTLDGGHYTACCLNVNNNRWYKFDDHEVHEASQSNIRSSAAYILFYTSIDQFIP